MVGLREQSSAFSELSFGQFFCLYGDAVAYVIQGTDSNTAITASHFSFQLLTKTITLYYGNGVVPL